MLIIIIMQICKVNSMSIGEYEYEVNYNIPTKTQPQLAKLSLVIFGTTGEFNFICMTPIIVSFI